jgi:hypothetical protein
MVYWPSTEGFKFAFDFPRRAKLHLFDGILVPSLTWIALGKKWAVKKEDIRFRIHALRKRLRLDNTNTNCEVSSRQLRCLVSGPAYNSKAKTPSCRIFDVVIALSRCYELLVLSTCPSKLYFYKMMYRFFFPIWYFLMAFLANCYLYKYSEHFVKFTVCNILPLITIRMATLAAVVVV